MSAEQALANLRAAETQWTQALKVHRLAPPDDGYSARLRGFADACEQQAAAYRYAGDSGLAWEPLPPGSARRPPAELLPDSARRGPDELWEQLDLAFEDLDRRARRCQPHRDRTRVRRTRRHRPSTLDGDRRARRGARSQTPRGLRSVSARDCGREPSRLVANGRWRMLYLRRAGGSAAGVGL